MARKVFHTKEELDIEITTKAGKAKKME